MYFSESAFCCYMDFKADENWTSKSSKVSV